MMGVSFLEGTCTSSLERKLYIFGVTVAAVGLGFNQTFWSFHFGVKTFVFGGALHVSALELLELINDMLEVFLWLEVELGLPEVLSLPKIRKLGWTVILLEIQSSIKLGELFQLDDLAVAESLAKSILGLVGLDQGLSNLKLFLCLLSSLLIFDYLLEKSSLGK